MRPRHFTRENPTQTNPENIFQEKNAKRQQLEPFLGATMFHLCHETLLKGGSMDNEF